MRCHLRLALGAILLCASSLTAAAHDESLRSYQAVIGTARAALRNNDPSTAKAMVRDLIPTLERHRKALSDRAFARKLSQLEALAREIESAPADANRKSRDAAAIASSRPTLLIDNKSPGKRCHSALGLAEGEPLSVALGRKGSAHDEVWLQWRAPAAGHYVFTGRSDDADPALSAFADCADKKATAENDDNEGLDAQLVLEATYAGQAWYLKASNVGETGTIGLAGAAATTISGRITSAATGEPISGIRVEARSVVGRNYSGGDTSGADGTYSIAIWWNADHGGYYVRSGESSYNNPNYLHEVWDDVPCTSADVYHLGSCGTGTAIALDSGQARTGIDFALGTGGEVSGRVLNAQSGEPVANAHVTILNSQRAVLRHLYTDAAGRYRGRGFAAPVTVYVHAASSEFQGEVYSDIACHSYHNCNLASATPVPLSAGAPARIDFDLTPLAYIEVDLTLEGSSDFSEWSTSFSVFHANGAVAATSANHQGNRRYHIGPLQPGGYLLHAGTSSSFRQWYAGVECANDCSAEQALATPIVVSEPGQRVRIAMDLQRRPALRGRVTDAATGEAIADAQITLRRNADGHAQYEATTGSDGSYELAGVGTGDYLAAVKVPGFVDQIHSNIDCEYLSSLASCPPAPTLAFGLTSGDRTANFALRRSPAVRGHLLSGNLPLPNGSAYWDSVRLYRGDRSDVQGTSLRIDAETGSYVLSDYPAGNYFLYAAVSGYFPQLADLLDCSLDLSSCPWAQARPYALGTADVQVDFRLKPRGRRVFVRDAAGTPLAGVAVDMWNDAGSRFGTTVSGPDGRLLLNLDPYSSASVRLSTDNYLGYFDQVYANLPCPAGTSVYRGGCHLTGATSIALPNNDPNTPEIVIVLAGDGPVVFGDSFE